MHGSGGATAMTDLILKRAATSRPSGKWSDDDYDVLADGAVIGRISLAPEAPENPLSFPKIMSARSNDAAQIE
jgi:hypothetical protein